MDKNNFGVEAGRIVRLNQPRELIFNNALIILFSCDVRKYIQHYHPNLEVKVGLDGLNISNINSSAELELLMAIATPQHFSFTLKSGSSREALFSYSGPTHKKLNAWRCASAVVKLLQEKFPSEWNSRTFVSSGSQEAMDSLLTEAEVILSS